MVCNKGKLFQMHNNMINNIFRLPENIFFIFSRRRLLFSLDPPFILWDRLESLKMIECLRGHSVLNLQRISQAQCSPRNSHAQCSLRISQAHCSPRISQAQCSPRISQAQCSPRISQAQCSLRISQAQCSPRNSNAQCSLRISEAHCSPRISQAQFFFGFVKHNVLLGLTIINVLAQS